MPFTLCVSAVSGNLQIPVHVKDSVLCVCVLYAQSLPCFELQYIIRRSDMCFITKVISVQSLRSEL